MEGVRRVLDTKMKTRDKVLVLLHHGTGWASARELFEWIEYSNLTNFRRDVLPLHKARLVEFDTKQDCVRISPTGAAHAGVLLKGRTYLGRNGGEKKE